MLHPLMQAAGDEAECIAYLMGNHVVAERMFRHDPRAILTVDQPTTQFGSFGIDEVSRVGDELDTLADSLVAE